MEDATCSNCRHSFVMVNQANPQQSQIVCRRYPPQVQLLTIQNAQVATKENPTGAAMIPQGIPAPVAGNWTCGEHTPISVKLS